MKALTTVSSLAVAGLILTLSGCGVEDDTLKSLYPEKPSISVQSIDVNTGGSEIIWHIKVDNKHPSTHIRVSPWNDTTYYYSARRASYNDDVTLSCNTQVQGSYLDCNKVDEVVCQRVGIGSDYSEYRCDLKVDGVLYPQFKEKMRVATLSNTPTTKEVLLTVGTEYWYESNGYEKSAYVFMSDENKMFNNFSGNIGP